MLRLGRAGTSSSLTKSVRNSQHLSSRGTTPFASSWIVSSSTPTRSSSSSFPKKWYAQRRMNHRRSMLTAFKSPLNGGGNSIGIPHRDHRPRQEQHHQQQYYTYSPPTSNHYRNHASSTLLHTTIPNNITTHKHQANPSNNPQTNSFSTTTTESEIHRLTHLRNVGILAHVDAGKTTVTERMLALAGVVHRAGSVDSGNTVTDYLPAERERGITIQSAAISFEWGWQNSKHKGGEDYESEDVVQIHLIDTPGHVDFSVEANRSVAVLDGAVLVVDSVAGVQAQTETVWRALTKRAGCSINNHVPLAATSNNTASPPEALPCLAMVNKMDKEGCQFGAAVASIRKKLPGANPIPIQIPLFHTNQGDHHDLANYVAMDNQDSTSQTPNGAKFMGVVDLIHMRAVIWPSSIDSSGEEYTPKLHPLFHTVDNIYQPINAACPITQTAIVAREQLIASLAEVDEVMEEYYLMEDEDSSPSNAELREALRRATISRKALPVLMGAALRGKGVEPLLDAVADLLPSPLDRLPPPLTKVDNTWGGGANKSKKQQGGGKNNKNKQPTKSSSPSTSNPPEAAAANEITIGHPLHPTMLAMAFKILHMKGRGGSGDGRVVFCRVYSGTIRAKDTVTCITPSLQGNTTMDGFDKPRTERVGAMLELAGGRFDNLEDGVCKSGDVCALVGLKSVVTGDTIMLHHDSDSGTKSSNRKDKKDKKKKKNQDAYYLAGVASPKPVLTVRLETDNSDDAKKLSHALHLLSIEDHSLLVEENEHTTLLSGLGELHIEVTLDRIQREYGVVVHKGTPLVSYRETLVDELQTNGLLNYDKTIGGMRMQASVQIILQPIHDDDEDNNDNASSDGTLTLVDPVVEIGPLAREFLGVEEDSPIHELFMYNEVIHALISGIKGSLARGSPLGPYPMGNVRCVVVNVDAEGGLPSLTSFPGSLRACAANAISTILSEEVSRQKSGGGGACAVLEPTMSVEVMVPKDMVGSVLSDLNTRRGVIGDVIMGDEDSNDVGGGGEMKALIRGNVPLVEILGYATSLRSLTAGEGAFTAEYKGHAPV